MEEVLLRPLKWYKSLSDAKFRYLEGYFLVEGKKAIDQLCSIATNRIEEILISDEANLSISEYDCPVRRLTTQQIHSICTSKTPQGIIAVAKIPQDYSSTILPQSIGERILLLEHVQDPGNIGTLIRTAAAFNYSGIIMSAMCADPFSPKVVQATSGSLFSVWLRRTDKYLEIIKELRQKHYSLLAADVRGESHIDFSPIEKHIIALGSEGAGLTRNLLAMADRRFSIPIDNKNVESLNVAVCGGILMFAAKTKENW